MDISISQGVCRFEDPLIAEDREDNLERSVSSHSRSRGRSRAYLLDESQADNNFESGELEEWSMMGKILLEKAVHLENSRDGSNQGE